MIVLPWILIWLFAPIIASITRYESLPLSSRKVVEDSFGVWARSNDLEPSPKLDLNLSFVVSTQSTGRIQIVLFRQEERNYIEALEKASLSMGDCQALPINSAQFPEIFYTSLTFMAKQENYLHINMTIPLNSTGTWNLRLTNCQNKQLFLYSTLVTGTLIWSNSYGYADTDVVFLFDVYIVESLGWFFMATFWIFLLFKNKQNLSGYQIIAVPILTLCFIEAILLVADQYLLNLNGSPAWLIIVMALVTGCIRRIAVMIICFHLFFGVGVVRKSLNYEQKILLGGLSVAFILGIIISSITGLRYVQEALFISAMNSSLVHLPNFIFSAIFLGWALIGAYETMGKLRRAKSDALLQLYHSMVLILCVSIIFMFFAALTKVFTMLKASQTVRPLEWIWTAFWKANFFVVLVSYLLLWKPVPGSATALEELEEEESSNAQPASDSDSSGNNSDSHSSSEEFAQTRHSSGSNSETESDEQINLGDLSMSQRVSDQIEGLNEA